MDCLVYKTFKRPSALKVFNKNMKLVCYFLHIEILGKIIDFIAFKIFRLFSSLKTYKTRFYSVI